MEQKTLASAVVLGVLIGAGVAVGGYFVGRGFYMARAGERYVTTKGLVERDVKADLAVWAISYTATGAAINEANDRIEQDHKLVTAFAQRHGFTADEIEIQPTTVTDAFANQFRNGKPDAKERCIVKGGVRLRSGKVDQVRRASRGDLLKQGVVLGENFPQAAQYFFTKLNDVRPAMLAEATRSARAVAEQFALDSHSQLGPIRRANQGVFEIMVVTPLATAPRLAKAARRTIRRRSRKRCGSSRRPITI
jgi:hypothetical protein